MYLSLAVTGESGASSWRVNSDWRERNMSLHCGRLLREIKMAGNLTIAGLCHECG